MVAKVQLSDYYRWINRINRVQPIFNSKSLYLNLLILKTKTLKMLNKSLVFIILILSASFTYSNKPEKTDVVIKTISEVHENMTELKFEVQNEFSKEELMSWVDSAKKLDLIKVAKVTNKKSREVVWVFNQTPTLGNFKYIFAILNVKKIQVNDKIMSAVEFTTFGFSSNNTNVKQ